MGEAQATCKGRQCLIPHPQRRCKPLSGCQRRHPFDVRILRKPCPPHRATRHRAAAEPAGLLLALRAPDAAPVRRHVRYGLGGRAHRHADPGVHRQAGAVDGKPGPRRSAVRSHAGLAGDGCAGADRPPAGAADGQPGAQQRRGAGCDQPDPMAKPLACGAPELAVFSERLCRPHRQPGDANQQRGARKCGQLHPCRLVHRDLRLVSTGLDGHGRLAPGRAHGFVVCGLCVLLAPLRAAHARSGQKQLGAAQPGDGARGGQLHQHSHCQAVCPCPRRRPVRARGDRRTQRRHRGTHAADHTFHDHPVDPECAAAGKHRRHRHHTVGPRPG
jgi:hypothetical protein